MKGAKQALLALLAAESALAHCSELTVQQQDSGSEQADALAKVREALAEQFKASPYQRLADGGIEMRMPVFGKATILRPAPAAHDALQAFDAAVAAELPHVSHVQYDSHDICKHFAGKVRERIAAMPIAQGDPAPKPQAADPVAQTAAELAAVEAELADVKAHFAQQTENRVVISRKLYAELLARSVQPAQGEADVLDGMVDRAWQRFEAELAKPEPVACGCVNFCETHGRDEIEADDAGNEFCNECAADGWTGELCQPSPHGCDMLNSKSNEWERQFMCPAHAAEHVEFCAQALQEPQS